MCQISPKYNLFITEISGCDESNTEMFPIADIRGCNKLHENDIGGCVKFSYSR